MLSSVAGVYYYLRVVVYMFMRPAPAEATGGVRTWATDVALALSTVAVVALGLVAVMAASSDDCLDQAIQYG